MSKGNATQFATATVNVTMLFRMRDCWRAQKVKQCNLLPQCYGCLVQASSIYDMNYYLKLFGVAEERAPFVFVDAVAPHYFTCVNGDEASACGSVLAAVAKDYHPFTKQSLKEAFVSPFGVLFVLFAVAMIAIEAWDASKVLRAKAVEKELWELYQTDQSQYASIMRSMREEEEEEEEEV